MFSLLLRFISGWIARVDVCGWEVYIDVSNVNALSTLNDVFFCLFLKRLFHTLLGLEWGEFLRNRNALWDVEEGGISDNDGKIRNFKTRFQSHIRVNRKPGERGTGGNNKMCCYRNDQLRSFVLYFYVGFNHLRLRNKSLEVEKSWRPGKFFLAWGWRFEIILRGILNEMKEIS